MPGPLDQPWQLKYILLQDLIKTTIHLNCPHRAPSFLSEPGSCRRLAVIPRAPGLKH